MTETQPEAEAALYARLPQRMVPDLERIIDLVDLLGSPQKAFPSIHVTGTNGKTSTVRMIDSLLRAFGLRTGRTTSPHLESIRERICLDGEPLTEEQFAAAYAEVLPYARIVDSRHADDVTFHEMLHLCGDAVPSEDGIARHQYAGTEAIRELLGMPPLLPRP